MDNQQPFRQFPDDLFGPELQNNENDQMLFSEDAPETRQTRSRTPWKVLIVDDEEDIHSVTEIALRDFTYRGKSIKFYSAYSAKEAREILEQNPDMALVLLDVVMETDQAGLDLVKYIRGQMNNQFIRISFFSCEL
jgi:two-component system sensor histidine kinase ChiS